MHLLVMSLQDTVNRIDLKKQLLFGSADKPLHTANASTQVRISELLDYLCTVLCIVTNKKAFEIGLFRWASSAGSFLPLPQYLFADFFQAHLI